MKKTGTFFLKKDNLQMGLILGLITPVIVFIIIYIARFSGYTFPEFIRVFFRENRLITFFGVWCLVGNIALFTYYINTSRDQTAKGIFAVTLIYGIGVLLIKLFN
ncbi:hypothetical protein [Flavisolibacter ginsengisoli]|nr:hypothetical protein [Flavisolibacter ginsengisoli]